MVVIGVPLILPLIKGLTPYIIACKGSFVGLVIDTITVPPALYALRNVGVVPSFAKLLSNTVLALVAAESCIQTAGGTAGLVDNRIIDEPVQRACVIQGIIFVELENGFLRPAALNLTNNVFDNSAA